MYFKGISSDLFEQKKKESVLCWSLLRSPLKTEGYIVRVEMMAIQFLYMDPSCRDRSKSPQLWCEVGHPKCLRVRDYCLKEDGESRGAVAAWLTWNVQRDINYIESVNITLTHIRVKNKMWPLLWIAWSGRCVWCNQGRIASCLQHFLIHLFRVFSIFVFFLIDLGQCGLSVFYGASFGI